MARFPNSSLHPGKPPGSSAQARPSRVHARLTTEVSCVPLGEIGPLLWQIVQREDGTYLVDGLLSFDEAQRVLGLPELSDQLEEIGFNTVAGFVLALLDRLPVVGDTLDWEGYTIEVVDMDGMRIDKVLIRPPLPLEDGSISTVLDTSY